MEQNNSSTSTSKNNNSVHMDTEAFEYLRQQLAATQAENANLRAQLDEKNEREDVDVDVDNQPGLEELNRAEEERDALQQENDAFQRLFERSRAQIAQLQMEQRSPEQLLQLVINLDMDGRHWHQLLHQQFQDCDDHLYQVQEHYMNEITQIQQSHAGQIEDFREEIAALYHERGHMLAQINGLRLALRNAQGDILVRGRKRRIDRLRRALGG